MFDRDLNVSEMIDIINACEFYPFIFILNEYIIPVNNDLISIINSYREQKIIIKDKVKISNSITFVYG